MTVVRQTSDLVTPGKDRVANMAAARAADESFREALYFLGNILDRQWDLGRQVVVGWCSTATGIEVLFVPNHRLSEALADHQHLLIGSRHVDAETMATMAQIFGKKPVSLTLPTVALGAHGVISVVANQAPGEMAKIVEHVHAGELAEARALHYRLLPVMRVNFVETNPVPVKTAMHLLGFCELTFRPPLGPPSVATVERVEDALRAAGLTAGTR